MVIGAGAIGRLYGGWLAVGGARVSMLARGAAVAELADGLTLIGPGRRDRVRFEQVTADAASLAPADAVIVATKLYDLEAAGKLAARLQAPVLGLQNGVSAHLALRPFHTPDRILVGPVYSPAVVSGAGEVTYPGGDKRIAVGNPFGPAHPVAARLVACWRAAGVAAALSNDIMRALWVKYLAVVTNAALTSLARLPAGVIYRDPALRTLARQSIAEAVAVGRAEGVALTDADAEAAFTFLAQLPPETVASMRQDLDAGRPLELDAFSGHLVRRGAALGVPTPFHAVVHACLMPFVDGARARR